MIKDRVDQKTAESLVKIAPSIKPATLKNDGWENVITGLGGIKDKKIATLFGITKIMTPDEGMRLLHHDDICQTICKIFPEMAFKKGYQLVVDGDADLAKEAKAICDDIEGNEGVIQGRTWGRASGGGLLFINTDQGKVEEELDLTKKFEILNLTIFDARNFWVVEYDQDITSKTFGKPLRYRISNPYGGKLRYQVIHASRVVQLPGGATAPREKYLNVGRDYSTLQCMYDVIRDFSGAFSGAATLLTEADVAMFGVRGLNDIIATKNMDSLLGRLQAINLGKSICNAIVLDAGSKEEMPETYQRIAANLQALPDMLDRMASRLSAATRIPTTVLMGEDPKSTGLQATGDASVQLFYDEIVREQTVVCEPALDRLYEIIFASMGQPDIEWNIKWNNPDPNSALAQAQLQKAVLEGDKIAVDMGALDPLEVRSHFTPDGFSTELTIDPEITTMLEESAKEPAPVVQAQPVVSSETITAKPVE